MVKLYVLYIPSILYIAACGSRGQVESADDFGADDVFNTLSGEDSGPGLEQVALTTAVDSITFTPTGDTGETFPPETSRLFLCFRVRGAQEGAQLEISWHRVDDDEPLSTTREVLTGDSRLAAEHRAVQPFWPGPHFVHVSIDNEEVARVPFVIEGDEVQITEALRRVKVTGIGVYQGVDRRGRPQGRPQRRFKVGTRSLHCAFRIIGAPPGTRVDVAWYRDGSREALTKLGTVAADRDLAASIGGSRPLPAGDYRAEVHLDGAPRVRTAFSIGAPSNRRGLFDFVLTRSINSRSRRPATPTLSSFRSSESTIYLCMRYDGMTSGETIDIRWIQDSHPEEPMAVSTVRTGRSGHLAASFSPEGDLPLGSYHAEVVIGDEVIEIIPFEVER